MIRRTSQTMTYYALLWCTGAIIGTALLMQCVSNPLAGGSSEETNARVLGMVIDSTGNPAPDTRVQLISSLFNYHAQTGTPDFPSDTTDSSGRYEIRNVNKGTYTLEAVNLPKRTRAMISGIDVKEARVSAPQAALQKPGSLKVTLPAGVDPVNGYVFIPGTTLGADLNGNSIFITIDSVPPGSLPPLLYANRNSTARPNVLQDSMVLSPGSVLTVVLAGWKFSKKLFINTTSSGANVADTVTGFPLLVRLTAENFPFNQAKNDGSDLRFSKSDGTSLSFEIEYWDALAQTAAVWVRLDTIFGNDNSHFLLAHWGNPNAAASSNSVAVFNGTNGYQGVWHLSDNTALSTVVDALGRSPGIFMSDSVPMSTANGSSTGAIGRAIDFQGQTPNNWVNLGTNKQFLSGTSAFTLSLWMNSDRNNYSTTDMLCFSKGGTLDTINPESRASLGLVDSAIQFKSRARDTGLSQIINSTATFSIKQWYHITSVVNVAKDSIYLYINGERRMAQKVAFGTAATDQTGSANSTIGANDLGTDDFFNGRIDEVRVESSARSAAWIKLNYENQKQNGLLVQW